MARWYAYVGAGKQKVNRRTASEDPIYQFLFISPWEVAGLQ